MVNPFTRRKSSNDPVVEKPKTDSVILDPVTERPFSGRVASGVPDMFVRNRSSNAENLYVKRLIVNKSNHYHDQYFRTFHSVLDDRAINDFGNGLDVDRINVNNASPFAVVDPSVARLANRFIAPDMSIDKKRDRVAIANNFDEARFVFIMEVVKEIFSGVNEVYIVTGFTDRCDVTYDRHNDDIVYIAPSTEFYINNVITMTETDGINNGYGNGNTVKLKNVQQVLYENPFKDKGYNHTGLTTITPHDIASRLQISHLSDNNTRGITLDSGFRNSANSTKSVSSLKFSRRGNTNVPEYVSRLVGGYKEGIVELQAGTIDEFSVWDSVISKVAEDKVRQNHFFGVLRNETRLEEGKCFTFKDLQRLSPGIDDVTTVNMGSRRRDNLNTEYHHNSSMDYEICLRIAHAMPSLLTSSSLEFIAFEVNNHTFDCSYNIVISNDQDLEPRTFKSTMDDVQMVNMFLSRLRNEVLNGLVENDTIPIEIYVEASLVDEIYIEVSFDGQPFVPWAMPAFADNQNSPIICQGDSSKYADEIAQDLGHIYDAIGFQDSLPIGNAGSFRDF